MAGNHVLLETISLTQSAASVTFDNIPQTGYTDLKVVVSARGSANNSERVSDISLKINNDTTASYSYKGLTGAPVTSSASSFSFSASSIFQYIGFGTSADATANTFGSTEFYFPNYTSNVGKSLSVDTVGENNSSTTLLRLIAGLWSPSTQAAISTLTFTLVSGSFVQYSTFSLYGVAADGTEPVIAPLATGGNIVANDGTYWYHAFLTSGNFVPQTALTCDYLVVAGGGAGGGYYGYAGGGGAGGLRSTVTATGGGGTLETALSLSSGTNYPISVGAGGSGNGVATNGSNSIFSTITSTGGGFAAYYNSSVNIVASTGGSGGGERNGTGAAGTANQGFAGGNSGSGTTGGGGGAGAAGQNGASGSAGGIGVAVSITGSSVYYAGGGGGSRQGLSGAAGGTGGGGAAGADLTIGTSGTANTGGGGGGSGGIATAGSNGGSGIVIIRYAMV